MSGDKYLQEIVHYIHETYGTGQSDTSFLSSRPRYADLMVFTDEKSGKMFAAIGKASWFGTGLETIRRSGRDRRADRDGKDFSDVTEAEQEYYISLQAEPDFIMLMEGQNGIFPARRMNRKNWISVLLDGSVSMDTLKQYIDESYRLATDSATRRIYEAVRQIPKGKVATYSQIAAMAGNPRMYRAVGNALHKNPDPEGTPCYRVVNGKGELSGAFAFGGPDEQANRLRADGIEVTDGKVDMKKYQMGPK